MRECKLLSNRLAYSKYLIGSIIILKFFRSYNQVFLCKIQFLKKSGSFLKKKTEIKFTPEMNLENFRGSFLSCYKTPPK